MQYCDYPSPPGSEVEKMERGQRLPPISTQLAGLFHQKLETPPVSPHDGRQAEHSSLKRKRSSDADASLDDSQQHLTKRPATAWNATSSGTSASTEPGPRTLPGLSGTSTQAPSPATYPDYRSPFRHVSQSTSRHGIHQSPHSLAPQSYSRPASEYHPTPTLQERGPPTTVSSSAPTIYDRLPPTLSARVLPPLHTPNSPRSAVEGRFDPSLMGDSRQLPPPLEPGGSYASTQSRYSYPPVGTGTGAASLAAPVDASPYAYSNPRESAGLATAPSHSYPPEPTRSSYSFDPVRHHPYPVEDRRITLPPMPGLSDPLPPPPMAAGPPSAAPPTHALDRYRFDAHPSIDHPARRRRGNLPKEATARLNDWFAVHAAYPYPKEEEKQRLQEETGLSMSQIGNWFINARRRRKPTAGNRPIDTLPPPPPGRHTFVSQTAPQIPTTLPLPAPTYDKSSYDYPRLPPPYP